MKINKITKKHAGVTFIECLILIIAVGILTIAIITAGTKGVERYEGKIETVKPHSTPPTPPQHSSTVMPQTNWGGLHDANHTISLVMDSDNGSLALFTVPAPNSQNYLTAAEAAYTYRNTSTATDTPPHLSPFDDAGHSTNQLDDSVLPR